MPLSVPFMRPPTLSSTASAGVKSLHPYGRFKRGGDKLAIYAVAALPPPYQRFYREWMGGEDKETPVHWKPKEEEWIRNPETGEVKRIQNIPIPVWYPDEMHRGLWGGEGVVEGMIKKAKYRSPVPRFWVPNFYKTVVYSEILDKYLSVVATERALKLVDDHAGLDSYLLKTPAYDLKSLLALKLKRRLFFALLDRDFRNEEPEKQDELIKKYKNYVISREDASWYGYSVDEATIKHQMELKEKAAATSPLKHSLRKKYFEQIKLDKTLKSAENQSSSQSWMRRMNPFAKPVGVQ